MSTIVAFVPNLMDRSKFPARVQFVGSATEAHSRQPTLIVVDIDRCDDAASFLLDGVEVVGYGPHVESESAAAALEAGYSAVHTRSVFFKRVIATLTAR